MPMQTVVPPKRLGQLCSAHSPPSKRQCNSAMRNRQFAHVSLHFNAEGFRQQHLHCSVGKGLNSTPVQVCCPSVCTPFFQAKGMPNTKRKQLT
eukprot:5200595-Amphidinium_carterae.1